MATEESNESNPALHSSSLWPLRVMRDGKEFVYESPACREIIDRWLLEHPGMHRESMRRFLERLLDS